MIVVGKVYAACAKLALLTREMRQLQCLTYRYTMSDPAF